MFRGGDAEVGAGRDHFSDNYIAILWILLGRENAVRINPNLVREHFGEPDVWELGTTIRPTPNKDTRCIAPEDVLPFIHRTCLTFTAQTLVLEARDRMRLLVPWAPSDLLLVVWDRWRSYDTLVCILFECLHGRLV